MVNTRKIKALMIANSFTQKSIAKELNISHTSFSLKLHNEREFKASEIIKLLSLLKISNIEEIFLP